MKKIVIVGAGEFQLPLIVKAHEKGYETHVFAWEEGAVGKKAADYFYPVSIRDKEKILEICHKIHPDAIATIATDLGYITATWLCDQLKLTGNRWEDVDIQTNKYKMRGALQKAGLYVPAYYLYDGSNKFDISTLRFPIIIKPTDRSGSRAVTKLSDTKGLEDALCLAVDASFEHRAIVEEFFKGDEYSCECISFEGRHSILAFTKKYTTNAPHFIEAGHIQPANISSALLESVKKIILSALNALNIYNGASHAEFRIGKDGQVCIMEIGARMGGDCIGSHLVKLSTGYDYMSMILDAALGEKPQLISAPHFQFAAIRFIFSQKDQLHLEKLEKKYPQNVIEKIRDITLGSRNVIDSGSRYGYTVFAGDDPVLEKEVREFENIL